MNATVQSDMCGDNYHQQESFGHIMAMSAEMAHRQINARKDMNWKLVLNDPLHAEKAKAAYNKELESLTSDHTVLQHVGENDPDFQEAKKRAVPGRALLTIKRDGSYKVRIVKHGDLEGTSSDPDGFNYYAHVVAQETVRALIATHDSSRDMLMVADVTTAFLQSHPFPEGLVNFIKVLNPITREWMDFRQKSSLYGEKGAPVRWEDTIAPWIESQGSSRGMNDRCIFRCQEKQLTVLLYVDDLLMSGPRQHVEWFYEQLASRFQTKEPQILEKGIVIDYLGRELTKTDEGIYVSMTDYTQKIIEYMDMNEPGRNNSKVSYPFNPALGDFCTE